MYVLNLAPNGAQQQRYDHKVHLLFESKMTLWPRTQIDSRSSPNATPANLFAVIFIQIVLH
jgi:hypothetical protein